MAVTSQLISVRMPEDILIAIDNYAKKYRCSRSHVIIYLLHNAIKDYEEEKN